MAKNKNVFECQQCGYQTGKWLGKCPDCGMWNSLVEVKFDDSPKMKPITNSMMAPKKINEIEALVKEERFFTGIKEFDRVVGNGITLGSINLIGGEPGIGKSTLLMDVCGKLASQYKNEKILYVSGEESEGQIAHRSKRMGIDSDNFYILHESNWQRVKEQLKTLKPKFFVLDSIQTTVSEEIQSASGTISQIREITYELMNYAKANGVTCFIIGHVTKDGGLSGPKVLEHMVDSVLFFEGDQYNYYRLLRVIKNRFGNTHEVGIFEMSESGLREVNNPSQYFIEKSFDGAYGRSLSSLMEGTRPIFVEIQALVVENKFGNGRRTTHGVDHNRLAMLVAVLEKYFEIPLFYQDIYVNVVGGLKLSQRDSDLSIAASLLSSFYRKPLDEKTLFLGEVGLTGEVRKIPMIELVLRECELLHYNRVITSSRLDKSLLKKFNIEVVGIEKITDLNKVGVFE